MVGLGAAEHLNIRPLDLRLSSPGATDAVLMALFETDAPRKMSVADGEEKTRQLQVVGRARPCR